ncbi:helix-turn-helix domain-containing protein [Streptomyces bacillaris]|uniref:helix-turn-helix domain-containing protein n=1 Tax=Streptomyces bacillaris TaxID=68179 RepID=UPI0036267774
MTATTATRARFSLRGEARAQLARELAEMYETASISDVAAARSLRDGTVKRLLVEAGAVIRSPGGSRVRRRPVKRDPARAELARALVEEYDAGATTRGLAVGHGLARGTVRRLLREGGVVMRPSVPPKNGGRSRCRSAAEAAARAALARDLTESYDAGASIRELVESRGLAFGTVQRLLREGGAVMRPPGSTRRPNAY